MPIKKLGLIVFFMLFGFSCSNKVNKNKKEIKTNVLSEKGGDECFQDDVKETIIHDVLQTEKLQPHIEYLVDTSIPIQLLENEFVTKSLRVYSNKQPVVIQDSTAMTEYTFSINFSEIDCENQKLFFSVWYPFEHANITGELRKQNGEWNVEIKGSGIVD